MDAIDPLTHAIAVRSLDFLELRQAFIAQNIANASTPGYRPVRLEFEAELRQAAGDGPGAVRALSARVVEAEEGLTVRVDLELAEATQTALRFSGLIEMLGRQFALQRLIVSNTGR